MIQYQNDCCDCSSPGFPCIGSRCELLHAPHYFCDMCGEEVGDDELYWFEGQQLCSYCIISGLEVVRADE